jgi:hypothetical protein
LLESFIITSWHGAGEAGMPADVKAIYTNSPLSSDPDRLNIFCFVLDQGGQVVHGFHGLQGRGGPGRSDWKTELAKAGARLGSPARSTPTAAKRPLALPDLPPGKHAAAPAGVRLYVRLSEKADPFRGRTPIVEVVPMKPDEWRTLHLPGDSPGKTVDAESLRGWLVHLYPAGIRTADQKIPFRKITGSLKLEPAGSDEKFRYALLRGRVQLAKGEGATSDTQSAFEGNLEVILTYPREKAEVHSARGVIEGNYLYRVRGSVPMPLLAAIESRPE